MDMIVKSESLTSVADAIRKKGETTKQLIFPSDFVTAIHAIKGGGGLNFEVVGGATRPSNPKENTIWVKTEEEIVSCVLEATAPSNPIVGMVWIEIGGLASVFIEVVEDSNVIVGLSDIKLYYDGAWNNVEAQIYQGGEWDASLSSLYLVKNGVANPTYAPTLFNGDGVLKKFGDVFRFAIDDNSYCVWYSKNKIPLDAGYDHAEIEITGGMTKYDLSIGVTSSKTKHSTEEGSPFGTNRVVFKEASPYLISPNTVNLDLSALTSPMWFGLSIAGAGAIDNPIYLQSGIDIKTIKLVRK